MQERIRLLQLLILNEYAARYAVARHYLGLVDDDEYLRPTRFRRSTTLEDSYKTFISGLKLRTMITTIITLSGKFPIF